MLTTKPREPHLFYLDRAENFSATLCINELLNIFIELRNRLAILDK